MRRNGFKRQEYDQVSYSKKQESIYIILMLCVDDVLIAGSNTQMINEHTRQLKRVFSDVNLWAVEMENDATVFEEGISGWLFQDEVQVERRTCLRSAKCSLWTVCPRPPMPTIGQNEDSYSTLMSLTPLWGLLHPWWGLGASYAPLVPPTPPETALMPICTLLPLLEFLLPLGGSYAQGDGPTPLTCSFMSKRSKTPITCSFCLLVRSKRYLVLVRVVIYKGEEHEDSRILMVEHSHWWMLMGALFMIGLGLIPSTINRVSPLTHSLLIHKRVLRAHTLLSYLPIILQSYYSASFNRLVPYLSVVTRCWVPRPCTVYFKGHLFPTVFPVWKRDMQFTELLQRDWVDISGSAEMFLLEQASVSSKEVWALVEYDLFHQFVTSKAQSINMLNYTPPQLNNLLESNSDSDKDSVNKWSKKASVEQQSATIKSMTKSVYDRVGVSVGRRSLLRCPDDGRLKISSSSATKDFISIRFSFVTEPDASGVNLISVCHHRDAPEADVYTDVDAAADTKADEVFRSRSNHIVLPRSGVQTSVFKVLKVMTWVFKNADEHEALQCKMRPIMTLLHVGSDINIGKEQTDGTLTRSKKNLTKKILYGMKQTSKLWYLRFENYMMRNGFKRRESDQGGYLKKHDSSYIIMVLYVDDLLIAGSNMQMINELTR
ncbi:hypothetical protein LXL04_023560 [Taraxacum kok-saghyz]